MMFPLFVGAVILAVGFQLNRYAQHQICKMFGDDRDLPTTPDNLSVRLLIVGFAITGHMLTAGVITHVVTTLTGGASW